MSQPNGTDLKALLAAARLPERSVPLCLRGDLVAQLQELQRQLVDLEGQAVSESLDGGPRVEVARQIQALRQQMAGHSIDVVVRAVPRRRWSTLLAEHPPREGNERDEKLGLDEDGFFTAALRECVVAPVFDAEDWAALDGVLSDAQWQSLTMAVWAVNARDVNVPFSQLASQILSTSDAG